MRLDCPKSFYIDDLSWYLSDYTNGYFYQCVQTINDYEWQNISDIEEIKVIM